jgi:pimeloyl-ACP methyl ester carboxylesterase
MVAMIVLLVVAVLGVAVGVRLLEPRLAFFPFAGEDVTPRQFGVEFSGFTLVTADGERLRAWHLPRPDALAQIVYFHGNGGNLSVWTDVLVGLWRERFDVVAVDYRGYGLSTGTPTEPGLYRDVESIISHVQTLTCR